ncbi:MAG TPA: hypothetical protein VII31_04215, partial [Caldimonas sp.]
MLDAERQALAARDVLVQSQVGQAMVVSSDGRRGRRCEAALPSPSDHFRPYRSTNAHVSITCATVAAMSDLALAETRAWVERAVIGLQLCP